MAEVVTGGGARLGGDGAEFSVWSHHAEGVMLCLFDDEGRREIARHLMERGDNGFHRLFVTGITAGTRYGYRAAGPFDPDRGFWFDPQKLLVDPSTREIDRAFQYDERLAEHGFDTAALVPKSIVTRDAPANIAAPLLPEGGLIYELSVKAFTILNPDIPGPLRGTVAALAHPAAIAHLQRIGVNAVELMPITAWIDERHLPPLGLSNAWGYNPVAFMALDPRLCPGGVRELRDTVAALHDAGIGVILDLVFNHTGESDRLGPTLSLRGLDNRAFFRHLPGDRTELVNDTGTGNTLDCAHPAVRRLILDTLRHFVAHAGVDGFRFDLAPILGRSQHGFSREAETLAAITSDPLLRDRVLIAEPWDIGPGGYQLGNFPDAFLEWNDRARDDIRRYWRGDVHATGALATRLAGSSDIFGRSGRSRSVNFLAAHDGFTLMDLVSHEHKHNEANGEDNRDGHNDNLSWNNGAEGESDDPEILLNRRRDAIALLSTLFASRGTLMLGMGDEAGRTQSGNNNAYAQDNPLTWFDWKSADEELIRHVAQLSALRRRFPVFSRTGFFTPGSGEVKWLNAAGESMGAADWERPANPAFAMLLATHDSDSGADTRLAVVFNRSRQPLPFALPGGPWRDLLAERPFAANMPARAVAFCLEAGP